MLLIMNHYLMLLYSSKSSKQTFYLSIFKMAGPVLAKQPSVFHYMCSYEKQSFGTSVALPSAGVKLIFAESGS